MVLHEAQIQLNKGDSVQQQSPSEPIGASREGDTTTSTERTTQQEREIGKEINLLCRPWLLRRTKLARKVALKQKQGMTGVSGVGGVGLVLCAERSCTYPRGHPPTHPPHPTHELLPPPPRSAGRHATCVELLAEHINDMVAKAGTTGHEANDSRYDGNWSSIWSEGQVGRPLTTNRQSAIELHHNRLLLA